MMLNKYVRGADIYVGVAITYTYAVTYTYIGL